MLIFLDIDGVMVPAKAWKAPELLEDGFPMFTEKATRALHSLLTPDTRVILSTSHRDRYSIDEWKTIFKRRGLPVEKLERLRPSQLPTKRTAEIQQWFDVHPMPNRFVIIDDDNSLHALPKHLKDHLVITSPLIGLTPNHLNGMATAVAG